MRPTLQTVLSLLLRGMKATFEGEARLVLRRREPGKGGAVPAGCEVQAPVTLQGGWGE